MNATFTPSDGGDPVNLGPVADAWITHGAHITDELIGKITIGETTEAELRELFGEPQETVRVPAGGRILCWWGTDRSLIEAKRHLHQIEIRVDENGVVAKEPNGETCRE